MMDLLNFPLFTALTAILFVQILKVPIRLLVTKEFLPRLVFSSGGMPSSHSAGVAALTTAIGIIDGVTSTTFALAFVFSVIIMFDAAGVRRQAGEQAIALNILIRDFQVLVDGAKGWSGKADDQKRKHLRELLGHKPSEVFFGALIGIGLAFLMYHFK